MSTTRTALRRWLTALTIGGALLPATAQGQDPVATFNTAAHRIVVRAYGPLGEMVEDVVHTAGPRGGIAP